MKGETQIKRYFENFIVDVWKEGNRLYKRRLRRPKVSWFHKKEDSKSEDCAGLATGWEKIQLCFEYAVYYKEEMEAVCIHEIAHSFSTYYCDLIGRKESDHGYLWRMTAKKLAKKMNCNREVAWHAYHEMELNKKQIMACKPKKRVKKNGK